MKNKILSILLIFIMNYFFISIVNAQNQFDFNVSEIEILDNGNKIVGSNRGTISTNDGLIIEADNFIYKKNENNLNAFGKVIINDTKNDYQINTDNIFYEKNDDIIFTKGKTQSQIYSRYIIKSSNVKFLRTEKLISSKSKTSIIDKEEQTYIELKNFSFAIEDELLKGENILVNLNYDLPQNDKIYFTKT